jgi:hypothetical protein
VRIIEDRTGLKIGCLEEIAFGNGWLTKEDMVNIIYSIHLVIVHNTL